MSGYFTVAQALHIAVVEAVLASFDRTCPFFYGSRRHVDLRLPVANVLDATGLSRTGDGVKDYCKVAIEEAIGVDNQGN